MVKVRRAGSAWLRRYEAKHLVGGTSPLESPYAGGCILRHPLFDIFGVAGSRKSGKLTCSGSRALSNGSGPAVWFRLVAHYEAKHSVGGSQIANPR